jgi:hypothetical protein
VLRLKLVNSIKLDVMQSTDHVINDDLSTNETVAVIKGTYQEVKLRYDDQSGNSINLLKTLRTQIANSRMHSSPFNHLTDLSKLLACRQEFGSV